MSSGTETDHPEPEGLQFDHAEFDESGATAAAIAASTVTCAGCRRPIADRYHEINGTIVCEECRGSLEARYRGGSKVARFFKAGLFGTGAGAAGSAIYFGVLHFFNYEVALISILCGYMVGRAVRKGTGDRGGWVYQGMAILITYLAIGAAYTSVAYTRGAFDELLDPPAGQAGIAAPPAGLRVAVVALVFVVSSVIGPVEVARQNVISLAIILFALWEAWKLTRAAKLVVTGPYQVGEAGPTGPIGPEPGHA